MSEDSPLLHTPHQRYVDNGGDNANTNSAPHHQNNPRNSSPAATPESTVEENLLKPREIEEEKHRQFLRRRFWWFCILGVLALCVLQLSFLPRTSLNRDFRRWHDLHLTKTDLKRIFLVQLKIGRPDETGSTNEEHIGEWLRNFTNIDSDGVTLADTENPSLASFVAEEFLKMGFSVSSHQYELPGLLRTPQESRVELVDSKSSRILYSADLAEVTDSWRFKQKTTPAFFPFGASGAVTGDFVYVNGGSPRDYALLLQNQIGVAGKIALIASSESPEYAVTDRVDYAIAQGCLAAIVIGPQDLPLTVSRNYKPGEVPEEHFRVPASFNSMLPILEALGPGKGKFSNWRYSPVSNLLRMKISSEFGGPELKARVVMGYINGVLNDGEIVIGASRDSLTSLNPGSSHAIMLEVMRAFKRLRRLGWKPLRTIKFVSWDASRSGRLGARAALQDQKVFADNMPLLAYINLDEDVVTGSHFSVDLNPVLNHVINQVAEIIPFSKNSTAYRRLMKLLGEETPLDDDDDDEQETSLLHYWRRESGANINNVLGDVLASNDAGAFQLENDTPVVNFKFSQSSQRNESTYVPELDHYSYGWLTEVDPGFDLHGLLVRFLGLLVLSLEEREVIDYRVEPYFDFAGQRLALFRDLMSEKLGEWATEKIDTRILERSSLLRDILEKRSMPSLIKRGFWTSDEKEITLLDVLDQFEQLLKDAEAQALIFDAYNHDVENLLTEDYPWYKILRKVHIYVKWKVTNYKLLRVERDLARTHEDLEFGSNLVNRHFMYEAPQRPGVCYSEKEREQRGAFASFYQAVEEGDFEQLVKLITIRYEHLHILHKKIQ